MNLTREQTRAIETLDGNLQIIACAGSGKTQVVSARVVEILKRERSEGIKPENIVAFTFTDKAAAELKDRIATLAKREFGDLPGMAQMYVGTIHGFCLELLQTYLFEYLKYGVLNDVQTKLLIQKNSIKSGLKGVEVISGPSKGEHLSRGRRDVSVYLEALNVIREDNVSQKLVPLSLKNGLDSYTNLLDQHRYLDYSRIMVDAVAALYDDSNPTTVRVQEMIAERIKFLFVDEYQDVNPLQEALVNRLHQLGASVCIVGDDDQTIYQWRGSEIANILKFADRYPDVTPVTLAENFRSSSGVVDSGRKIAEINNPHRLAKTMQSASHQTFERGDLLALTFDSPQAEAKWIADKILALRGTPFLDERDSEPRGLSWSDSAILLRSVRKSGEAIVEALKSAGIPYLIAGLANLFETPEVQACVSLFLYITDEISADDVRDTWADAELGLDDENLDQGLAVLDRAKSWEEGERWAAYNIQRAYLDFLEAVSLREERIPVSALTGAPRGEIVYYNLGKFSQVISDYEQIYFQSKPEEKYKSFVYWLLNEAPDYYEEGGEDVGFAQPDAVQIMTVHQAKGMEWPCVFIPALQRNRFPSAVVGGRSKWHILPKAAVTDADRYDGSVEDERRLFYVAITRSKKYLYCSFAPVPGNRRHQNPSQFLQEFTQVQNVLTSEPTRPGVEKIDPRSKRETPNVVLSFSELKYFFECPYSFKLRFLYGFNPPLHEALGFGKSLHDALAEIHKRALAGDLVDESEVVTLVDNHLHTPFAYPALRDQLRKAAIDSLRRYMRQHGATLSQTIHSEQQVEIQVSPGITVNGRIDLIKRLDTQEVAIVDFKSTERAQAEDVTRAQLHTYAIGYQQLTGENADLVEVLNLDEAGRNVREVVDSAMLTETTESISLAGTAIRDKELVRLGSWCRACATCDLAGVCRNREG